MSGQNKQKATKGTKAREIEALTKAAHDTAFAWESLRNAHANAGRVAQIELLQLTAMQATIMNRTKHLLECVAADAKAGGA